jgi:hypothetical protein
MNNNVCFESSNITSLQQKELFLVEISKNEFSLSNHIKLQASFSKQRKDGRLTCLFMKGFKMLA